MKRIKAMNGYTIYQMTARDEKNGDGIEGEYAVFFSSDVREYGVKYSTPEWDGIDSLQEAEWICNDKENVTYAKARALCEAESTCFSYEDVEEKIEELKQRGIDATAYETADELEEAMEETMNTFRITFQYSENTYCTNIAKAQNADDVEEYYESKGQRVISIEQATDADIREAERKGMPVITIEESETQQASSDVPDITIEQRGGMSMRRDFDTYREMMDAIPALEQDIRDSLESQGYTIYTVYIAVQDEANRLYFCDIEYGKGDGNSYNRIYRKMNREALEKFFHLSHRYVKCRQKDSLNSTRTTAGRHTES